MFSRDYLQNLPNLERQKTIKQLADSLFKEMEDDITSSALHGKKRYLHDMARWRQQNAGIGRIPGSAPWSFNIINGFEHSPHPLDEITQELVAVLKEKFPGCAVSYQEDWVEQEAPKYLKKCILVDWS
jgi:hypothetical protein